MPAPIEPSSSPHQRRGAVMVKGVKRPRKSTQREIAAQAAANTQEAGPSAGPRDILKPRSSASALAQDEIAAYSATPPTQPAKKLSRSSLTSRISTEEDRQPSPQGISEGSVIEGPAALSPSTSSPSSIATGRRPVKSALASSARLATMGLPSGSGNMVSSAYRRTMHIEYVKNAFAQKDRGSSKDYHALVSQFRSSALSLSQSGNTQSLSLWLLALSYHVSRLDAASHSQLVENILDLPWAGASDDFVRSWCRFVCALVSARTEWAPAILTRIVKALRWRSDWLPIQPLNAPSAANSSAASASKKPTRRLLYARVHLLLRAILSLIPTLPSTLSPLLIRHFPHKREGKKEQATYVRNLLFVTLYESQVAETVWRTVADRAISLDVEIQIELDELEDGALAAGIEEDLANLDPFDRPLDQDDDDESSSDEGDEEGDEDDSDSDAEGQGFEDISDDEVNHRDDADDLHASMLQEQEEETKQRKVRELVGKLDALLKVCFEHLERVGKGKRRTGSRRDQDGSVGLGKEFEKVLDSRDNWLHDFLGTGRTTSNSSTPSGTPTIERTQSQLLDAIKNEEEATVADIDDANLEDLDAPTSAQPHRQSSPAISEASSTSTERDDEPLHHSRQSLFQHLLHLFSRSILPTFKCRHVQFLLFWYCSLESDFADYFLGLLIHKAIYSSPSDDQPNVLAEEKRTWGPRGDPMVLRQAAASYVASFVSRAKYITPQYTRTVVFNLCSFLEAHIDEYSNAIRSVQEYGLNSVDEATGRLASAPPGSDEHAIFYAVAQAVFYIFCFRWQDLQMGAPGQASAGESSSGKQKQRERSLPSDDQLEADPGFMFGSLSSTGSSSFALPSSLHRAPPPSTKVSDLRPPSASPYDPTSDRRESVSSSTQSNGYPLSPALSATVVPPTASRDNEDAASGAWASGLGILQRVIVCPLNPLQFCSYTVVQQFASVSQHVGFLYCWSVIDANRRGAGLTGAEVTSTTSSAKLPDQASRQVHAMTNSRTTRANNANKALTKDLEGFFPFDPYRLHGTADRFVHPLYREWKDVVPAGLDDDGDDDSDSDESASEDDEESDSGDSGSEAGVASSISPITRTNQHALGIPVTSTAAQHNATGGPEAEADSRGFAKSMEAMSVSAG
ncbi:unnamed protein product [Parajaminaea phylloscopi]